MNTSEKWERIYSYWENRLRISDLSCKGATTSEIEQLESHLQFELPESFIESLKNCNHPYLPIQGYTFSWFGSHVRYMNVDEIIEFYDQNRIYAAGNHNYYKIYDNIVQPKEGWPDKWVPFMDAFGIYATIDLRDDIGDQYGQIILMDPSNGRIALWADSYENFLTEAIDIIYKRGNLMKEFYGRLRISYELEDVEDEEYDNDFLEHLVVKGSTKDNITDKIEIDYDGKSWFESKNFFEYIENFNSTMTAPIALPTEDESTLKKELMMASPHNLMTYFDVVKKMVYFYLEEERFFDALQILQEDIEQPDLAQYWPRRKIEWAQLYGWTFLLNGHIEEARKQLRIAFDIELELIGDPESHQIEEASLTFFVALFDMIIISNEILDGDEKIFVQIAKTIIDKNNKEKSEKIYAFINMMAKYGAGWEKNLYQKRSDVARSVFQ